MLEPDVREEHDPGSEHVRRVVAPAEAGLDNGNVDPGVRERDERSRRDDLELRRAQRLGGRARMRATVGSKSASSPSSRIRSLQAATCGEIVEPTRSPSESRSCSIVIVAVDLPFVPTTWIAGYASCGSPSSASSARIRSSPKPSRGHGLIASSHSTAVTFLAFE